MIELINVTKIFKSKKKKQVKALDAISFKLPDKGMYFVVGKSGSGKTTLLSLIGGLDNLTSGEIIYDGKKFSSFTRREFDDYRNNFAGFIFQDYQLLEDLNIFDNVKLMLDFQDEKSDQKVYEVLEKVGLKGFENRYPKELSGGEKQRVAVARVIVKKSKIILADEPTGNLDRENTIAILNILKDLSKDHLVLIVSHNVYDAYEYADKILELKSGKIIRKIRKVNDEKFNLCIKNDELFIPLHKKIDINDKNKVLTDLKQNKIKKVSQLINNFEEYDEDSFDDNVYKSNLKKHISFKNSLKYGFKISKSKFFGNILFSFLFAILISISGLCWVTSNYSTNEIIDNVLSKEKYINYAIWNNNKERNFRIDSGLKIDENYENIFRKNGYQGKIYKYLSFNNAWSSTNYPYAESSSFKFIPGFLKTDKEYLIKLFGQNGKLDFIYKVDNPTNDGVYITDYVYESALHSRSIKENPNFTPEVFAENLDYKINGIINSHFKEKYAKYLPYFFKDEHDFTSEEKSVAFDEKYYEIQDQFTSFLSIGYLLEDVPFKDVINNNYYNPLFLFKGISELNGGTWVNNQHKIEKTLNLKNDEIIIDVAQYEKLVGKKAESKDLTLLDKPFKLHYKFYSANDYDNSICVYEKDFKVVGYREMYCFSCNEEVYNELIEAFNFPTRIYFSDYEDAQIIYKSLKELNLSCSNYVQFNTDYYFSRIISPFKDLFAFLNIILIAAIILGVSFYEVKLFKSKLFEIGVMKSLGARDKDILIMMMINIFFFLLGFIIFYNILESLLIPICDSIMIKAAAFSFSEYTSIPANLKLLFLHPTFLLCVNLIFIFVVILLSIIPFIKLRYLKPTNIIKAKE